MNECIYSRSELLSKIKSLDTQIESSISTSRLDTGQSVQTFGIDVLKLREQRNWYYRMLQQYYPGNYADIIAIRTARR